MRKKSGYTQESLADKLDKSVEEIREVEDGKRPISLKEIHKLADLYERPLTVFFSDEVPDIPYPRDFRINRDKGDLSPKVYLAERRAFYLATRIYELVREKSQFPELTRADLGAGEMAEKYRSLLMFDQDFYSVKRDKLLSWYKELLENKHRIIVMEYEFDSNDVRAFSLQTDVCVIVLNEKDKAPVKLFSMMHEMCHLLRKEAAVCFPIANEAVGKNLDERFCDMFASEFLIPNDVLVKEITRDKMKPPISASGTEKLARYFGVSYHAMSIKLYDTKFVPKPRDYSAWNSIPEKLDEDNPSKLNKKRTGGEGKNWRATYRNRVGNFALREIENAFRNERITYADVLDYSGLKSKYAKELMEL